MRHLSRKLCRNPEKGVAIFGECANAASGTSRGVRRRDSLIPHRCDAICPLACDFPRRALGIAPHRRGPHRENNSYLPPYAVHSEINQLKTVKTWGGVAITTAILIVISANFFDRPIALFSYRAFGHLMIVRQFAATPGFFGPLEVFVVLIFLARRIAFNPLERPDLVLILCEASLLLTNVLSAFAPEVHVWTDVALVRSSVTSSRRCLQFLYCRSMCFSFRTHGLNWCAGVHPLEEVSEV